MEKHLNFGTRRINYHLSFTKRKSLGVKVHPDSSVQVIAPENADEKEVAKKIKLKAPWIIKQQDFFISFKPATPERRFVNGETHLYLGRQYKLKTIVSETPVIKAYRGQLVMYSTSHSKEDIAKHRRVAKTDAIWVAWFKEMVLKTVLKKSFKYHFDDIIAGVDEMDNESIDLDKVSGDDMYEEDDVRFENEKKKIFEVFLIRLKEII